VANAVNIPGTRIDAPALRDLSYTCFSKMNTYASYIQKRQRDDWLIELKPGPPAHNTSECLGEQYGEYLNIMSALSKGYPVPYSFNLWATKSFFRIIDLGIFQRLIGGHMTLALEPTSSGDLLIYDPNFQGGSDGKITLDYKIDNECNLLRFKYPPSLFLPGVHPEGDGKTESIYWPTSNLFYIHQQNCKQAGICPNYNDYYLFDVNGQSRVHLSQLGLDDAVMLSDDYFSKWLEYQYADNYLA